MNQNCVIYGRLSKGDAALESHEARAVTYAQMRGFNIVATFEDPDTSGRTPIMDRKGGRGLFSRLECGDVRHLIVVSVNRLGRYARDVLGTLERLEARKIILHIVDFGGDTITTQGHMGKLILTIFAGIAEWEREEIADRTRKRSRHQQAMGLLYGTAPYGFDVLYTFADGGEYRSSIALWWGGKRVRKDAATGGFITEDKPAEPEAQLCINAHGGEKFRIVRKELVANLQEQHWLRQIAAWRAAGMKYKDIAARLNAAGVQTKNGGPWHTGQVDRLLNSRSTKQLLGVRPSPGAASDLDKAA